MTTRKQYNAPLLERFGAVTDLTAGGSGYKPEAKPGKGIDNDTPRYP